MPFPGESRAPRDPTETRLDAAYRKQATTKRTAFILFISDLARARTTVAPRSPKSPRGGAPARYPAARGLSSHANKVPTVTE